MLKFFGYLVAFLLISALIYFVFPSELYDSDDVKLKYMMRTLMTFVLFLPLLISLKLLGNKLYLIETFFSLLILNEIDLFVINEGTLAFTSSLVALISGMIMLFFIGCKEFFKRS